MTSCTYTSYHPLTFYPLRVFKMSIIRFLNPDSLPDPSDYLYSHVSVVEGPARIIHTAGQVATDKEGKTPEGIEDQFKLCLNNIKDCLAKADATVRDIYTMTIYVVDYTPDLPIWGPLGEFLTDNEGIHLPPAALIPVPCLALPKWKVEIQATAAVPTDRE